MQLWTLTKAKIHAASLLAKPSPLNINLGSDRFSMFNKKAGHPPVAFGIVSNLARPGGNITGVSVDAGLEIWAKHLQILREVVPTAGKVAYLNARFATHRANQTPHTRILPRRSRRDRTVADAEWPSSAT